MIKANATITLIRVDDGKNGVSISKTEPYYYLSTSSTTQSGGAWVTPNAPAWVNGRFYWWKIKTTYSNGTTSESTPICVTGAKGDNGTSGKDGKSVVSITTEFYLSTSKTTQSGGTWGVTPPTWSSGKYLWTRNKIVYANPSSTVYTTAQCDSTWEAVNEVQIGGRNYILKSNTFVDAGNSEKATGTSPNTIHPSIENELWKIVVDSPNNSGWHSWVHDNIIEDNFLEGDTFTFSFEIKSADCLTTNPPTIYFKTNFGYFECVGKVGAEWSKCYYTGKWEKEGLLHFHFSWASLQGTYYIRKLKFEAGNKPTDWIPAQEDIENDYNNKFDGVNDSIQELVSDYTSAINKAEDNITLKVSQQYYTKDETKTLVQEQSTLLQQTKDSFEMQFNQFRQDINNIQNGSNAEFEDIRKYIRFIDGNIFLGQIGNELELKISNNRISFYQGGSEVAYFSNNKLNVTDVDILHSLVIGKFAYVPRENGTLDFKKVG